MSHRATARETHDAHADERNRVRGLARRAQEARDRAHKRALHAVPSPAEHQHRTPIVHPYDHRAIVGHMLLAGETDDTGFSDGLV